MSQHLLVIIFCFVKQGSCNTCNDAPQVAMASIPHPICSCSMTVSQYIVEHKGLLACYCRDLLLFNSRVHASLAIQCVICRLAQSKHQRLQTPR